MAATLWRAVMQRLAAPSAPTYGLRRFLQERPTFRPAVLPDRGFMPLANRIRDLSVAFPHINLDGFVLPVPPAPAWEVEVGVEVSLTAEKVRKVLQATQMEAARARLRVSGAGAVPYAEFLRLCCFMAGAAMKTLLLRRRA